MAEVKAVVSWCISVALVACGGGDGGDDEVVVLAAASLTDAFGALGESFEELHPGTEVVISAAGSSELATQVIEGAPADVFASADVANMARVVDAGAVAGQPRIIATNRSEILVASGNPLGITGVSDLADPDLVVVTCAPNVPCGRYATEIFANAGVDVVPDSFETSVRSVVTKIAIGEADAGVVYATDVLAARDDTDGVAIPDDVNVVADYPVAVLTDAAHPAAAQEFVDFLEDGAAQAILAEFGFAAP